MNEEIIPMVCKYCSTCRRVNAVNILTLDGETRFISECVGIIKKQRNPSNHHEVYNEINHCIYDKDIEKRESLKEISIGTESLTINEANRTAILLLCAVDAILLKRQSRREKRMKREP